MVCVDRTTGEPSRGNVGIFRLTENQDRIFNHNWFAPPPPDLKKIEEAHLAQNPSQPPNSENPDRCQKHRNGADSPQPIHPHKHSYTRA